jgi:hypothetical protein
MDLTRPSSENTKILWGMVAKNLLVEGAMEGQKPRLVQLLESSNYLNERHHKQEFALAHNLRLTHGGQPDPYHYDAALKKSQALEQRERKEKIEHQERNRIKKEKE